MKHFTKAKWITPEQKTEPEIRKGAGYLKKQFIYEGGFATLFATAHGLYHILINGSEITGARLTPGCDEYDKRLQYQKYNVTNYLIQGENEILVTLGDGWYRGCNGIDGIRNLYGTDLSFICALTGDENTEEPILVSDESWLGSENGGILLTDLELGETCDMRKELSDWHEVRVLSFDQTNLVEQRAPFIKEHERFEGRRITTPAGETVFDFGQNLAGYTQIQIKDAADGDTLTLIHGETLDENGNFTISNFQPGDRNKAGGIKQEIRLTCKSGDSCFKPLFSIFGFRYAKLVTDIPAEKITISSIAVYSDMKQTASFECGNPSVDQLFQNSIWSMKSNFCDIPTDCPTRERAGWTGDAAVFIRTGLYLMDCRSVYEKWLANVRACQHDDGKMAYICPKNSNPGKIAEMFSASVGWGDAAVIVPWNLYCMSGDRDILSANYSMMKRWVDFLKNRAGKSKLKNRFGKNPYKNYIIDTGMDYGEWCEPGKDMMKTMAEAFKNGQPEVATAYFANSARILSEVADILGFADDADHYGDMAAQAKKAYQHLVLKDGHIHSERQCEYVRPLAFGLLEEKEAKTAAEDLNRLVIQNGYHLNTGFLSTPYLCQVLAEYGYEDTAYRLLLQKEYPSWLYSVEKGATTIWETWDGIREDNTVHDSLNHYSYGAISGWLISGVCGIDYNHDRLVIHPVPNPLLAYAKGSFEAPEGRIVSQWEYKGETLAFHIEIPAGIKARFYTPDGKMREVTEGVYDYECGKD
ncbi:MAG: glycoside hydrolase family 78 protein [Lachnospiraceae bacterium]|nr:glycoside hydrolase family 78 protein [Lachnospiraceae bacterium]